MLCMQISLFISLSLNMSTKFFFAISALDFKIRSFIALAPVSVSSELLWNPQDLTGPKSLLCLRLSLLQYIASNLSGTENWEMIFLLSLNNYVADL